MTFVLSPETIAACQAVLNQHKGTVAKIVDAVSEQTGIPARLILSPRKDAPIARARQIVMYEARQHGLSLTQIGNAMGRDHTTIRHGIAAEKKRRVAACL